MTLDCTWCVCSWRGRAGKIRPYKPLLEHWKAFPAAWPEETISGLVHFMQFCTIYMQHMHFFNKLWKNKGTEPENQFDSVGFSCYPSSEPSSPEPTTWFNRHCWQSPERTVCSFTLSNQPPGIYRRFHTLSERNLMSSNTRGRKDGGTEGEERRGGHGKRRQRRRRRRGELDGR